MSFLGDIGNFALFHTKDILGKIKKNPERLLYGGFGTDPLSAKVLNKATGSNYEPLVDQMGGAYGGHTFSMFGKKDGGVYQRAEEAGIDTGAGGAAQDLAHVVAGLYAGNYAQGQAQGLNGSFSMGPGESSGGSGLLSSGGNASKYANFGTGLLQQGQPQPASAPQAMTQPRDVQAEQAARIKLLQEMQLQSLRQKPNKTLDEWQQLQAATRNQGLLGDSYG